MYIHCYTILLGGLSGLKSYNLGGKKCWNQGRTNVNGRNNQRGDEFSWLQRQPKAGAPIFKKNVGKVTLEDAVLTGKMNFMVDSSTVLLHLP